MYTCWLFDGYKEKAEQLLEHEQWLKSHIVYDEEITLFIVKKIGRFNEVKTLDAGYFSSGDDSPFKSNYFHFILDNRWFVTVIEQPDPFEDIEEELISYMPKDHQSSLILDKIHQFKESFPGIIVDIYDLSEI